MEEAARKAEVEMEAKSAKAKVRKATMAKKQKTVEVESGSEVEPRILQKKGKKKAKAMSSGSIREAEDACQR
jgi:hypothetical protein